MSEKVVTWGEVHGRARALLTTKRKVIAIKTDSIQWIRYLLLLVEVVSDDSQLSSDLCFRPCFKIGVQRISAMAMNVEDELKRPSVF